MSERERGSNGFWAGYVATKARAGEFDEAWEMMLANYDHESNWGLDDTSAGQSMTSKFVEGVIESTRQLKECSNSDNENLNCETPLRFESFPEALETFLKETGYISPDRVVDLSHDVAG